MSASDLWRLKLDTWQSLASGWKQAGELGHPLAESTIPVPEVPRNLLPSQRVAALAKNGDPRQAFLSVWRLAPSHPTRPTTTYGPSGFSFPARGASASGRRRPWRRL